MNLQLLVHQLFISLCLVLIEPPAQQRAISSLPKDAQIIEERTLSAQGYPDRKLVLWMVNPKRN
ncbi:MAG TPA: hypothetical protein VGB07_36870, partial [Blastocatellia bacterium]